MDLSIIIPSRNEMFLRETIQDIISNIEGNTEVIAILDGAWAEPPIPDHPRVTLIYHSESIGQRAATNEGAKLSQAKFIMKVDAHCAFDKGFDIKLMRDCQYQQTMVPRMYNLHAFNWLCACGNETYQGPTPTKCEKCGTTTGFTRKIIWKPRISRRADFMRFDSSMKFQYWGAFEKREEAKTDIAPQLCCVGACWMMHRQRYWDLGGLDESHGSWGQMGVEIACKSWLSGGEQVVNKKTWFSHMFRTQGGDFGFPYLIRGRDVEVARKRSRELWKNNKWSMAKHNLQWLLDKFKPIPDWHDKKKTIVYYTDNHCDEYILDACRKQLLKCSKLYDIQIISVSQKPLNFGHNIVVPLERSLLSMFRQILKGIESANSDIIFLAEHDVLYSPSHFDFIPTRKDIFYYDRNRWAVCADTGKAVFYQSNQVSHLCAYKEVMLKHYRRVVELVEKNGFKHEWGFSPPRGLPKGERIGKYDCYMAKSPSVDVRHSGALTRRRMDKSEFRSERSCRDWTESDSIPSWGVTKGRFKEFLKEMEGANHVA